MKDFKSENSNRADARTLRLCKIALRIVSAFVSEQTSPSALESCVVLEVRPGSARNHLVVLVGMRSGSEHASLGEILEAFTHLRGAVRSELAQVTQRKRVPMIEFDVVPLTIESQNSTKRGSYAY